MPGPIFSPLSALHRPDMPSDSVLTRAQRQESPAGVFRLTSKGHSVGRHDLALMMTRDEVAQLHDFMARIRGRWKAFWCPSYRDDLWLMEDVAANDTTITIQWIGYTVGMFPIEAKRHIAFCFVDGTFLHSRIEEAVDNEDGTETLTLDCPLGRAFTRDNGGTVSWLWYGRMEADGYTINYSTKGTALCDLTMVELPNVPQSRAGGGGTVLYPNAVPCVAGERTIWQENWRYQDATGVDIGNTWVISTHSATAAFGPILCNDGTAIFSTANQTGFADIGHAKATFVVRNLTPGKTYKLTASVAAVSGDPRPFGHGVNTGNGNTDEVIGCGTCSPGVPNVQTVDVVPDSLGRLYVNIGMFDYESLQPDVTFEFGPIRLWEPC